MSRLVPGRVLGVAGGGLQDASWAANVQVAEAGARGEVLTAAILDPLACRSGGATVLHDLMIPNPGITANIDHVVVAGSCVWLVDAKLWRPGFYSTVGGVSRRGWVKAPHLDKQTMVLAAEGITRFLTGRGITHVLAPSAVVVHPSRQGASVSLWAARMPGADLVSPAAFRRRAARFMRPGKGATADPFLVDALSGLLVSSGGGGYDRRSRSVPRTPAAPVGVPAAVVAPVAVAVNGAAPIPSWVDGCDDFAAPATHSGWGSSTGWGSL